MPLPSALRTITLVLAAVFLPSRSLREDPKPAPQRETPAEERAYPTFDPFQVSGRFRNVLAALDKADIDAILVELQKIEAIFIRGRKAGEKYGEKRDPKLPSAMLERAFEGDPKARHELAPAVMAKLEPLRTKDVWTEKDLAFARSAAVILSKLPCPPKVGFEGEDSKRHRGDVETLVSWYHTEVARPECYAAMLGSGDDGPFGGLPYEAKESLPATAEIELDEKTEIRLCKTERAKEPWVIQGVRNGELAWSRVVSGSPDESVAVVELGKKAIPVGRYGWIVPMHVEWSFGGEAAQLYVGPEGEFLFYFMGW